MVRHGYGDEKSMELKILTAFLNRKRAELTYTNIH